MGFLGFIVSRFCREGLRLLEKDSWEALNWLNSISSSCKAHVPNSQALESDMQKLPRNTLGFRV